MNIAITIKCAEFALNQFFIRINLSFKGDEYI